LSIFQASIVLTLRLMWLRQNWSLEVSSQSLVSSLLTSYMMNSNRNCPCEEDDYMYITFMYYQ